MALKIGNNEVENLAIGATELDALMLGNDLVWEKPQQGVIYGWHVDPSISDPSNAITYLNDAVGKTPAAMGSSEFNYGDWADAFFMPKPCMLKFDGTVDYYLDPNDYTKKADGTNSDIADPNYGGNAMMEWGLIWYKFEAGAAEGEGNFYVANYQVDSSYKCWCNINANNEIIPHFYTAIYNGTGTTKLRSLSGILLTTANGSGGVTVSQDMAKAEANGANNGWGIDVLADRLLINSLLVLMGKSLNSKAVFGNGIDSDAEDLKSTYRTGTTNNKGLFWGDTTNYTNPVKVFGMENWWGCAFRNAAGHLYISNICYIKLTSGTADGSSINGYSFSSTNGYINLGNFSPISQGYIQKMKFMQYGFFPMAVTNTSDVNWCNWMATFGSPNLRRALYGGNVSNRQGAFAIDLTAEGGTSPNISSCLSCKPLATN